jgi:hypothetical protein
MKEEDMKKPERDTCDVCGAEAEIDSPLPLPGLKKRRQPVVCLRCLEKIDCEMYYGNK